jgi:N-acetylmuramoyl-L-alanine amidase
MKRLILFFGILSLLALFPEAVLADRRGFVNTVVIDPGHGGNAPGAVGRRSLEKDIALTISLLVGQYIEENLPDVKVIYTRTTDVAVALHERARIANENNADLFISIHCNSTGNSSALGTETFVMGLHRSQANLEVARKENAAILYEEDYLENYDGFDPNSPEANIIFTMYQNAYLEQSLSMASLVQNQFRDRARRVDRGVKQAGFLVLYQVTMPGILVEAGFISNPREEEYLMSASGQAHIASAIFRAFRDYKEEQDALAAARRYYAYGENESVNENEPNVQETQAGQVGMTVPPETAQPEASTPPTPQENGSVVVFRVQFASTREEMPLDAPEFRGLQDVGWYFHEGLYKYTVGNEASLEDAARLQARVHETGFRDAFVVAFVNEERIPPSEAIRLLSQQESNP